MAGAGSSLCLRYRHQTAGATFQGAYDAEVQAGLGEAAFRPRRPEISALPRTVDRGMAPAARAVDRLDQFFHQFWFGVKLPVVRNWSNASLARREKSPSAWGVM